MQTQKAGHGWRHIDLAPWFGKWIARNEFFDALIEQLREIRGLLPDIEDELVSESEGGSSRLFPSNDVLAVDGCGALFGVARVSTLISKIADSVPGRLLVGFPGKHSGGVYRLLDARDGWNYHAIPIPSRQCTVRRQYMLNRETFQIDPVRLPAGKPGRRENLVPANS